MKLLGCYSEFWPSHPEAVDSVRSSLAAAARADEGGIVAYLLGGHMLFASMGAVEDVLGSGEHVLGGGSLLTDGEWVWRGDLWFYVSRHHVVLPDQFRAKAQVLGYTAPSVERDRLAALTDELWAVQAGERE